MSKQVELKVKGHIPDKEKFLPLREEWASGNVTLKDGEHQYHITRDILGGGGVVIEIEGRDVVMFPLPDLFMAAVEYLEGANELD